MLRTEPRPVGYIVKRYPRYSETFIVTEILAHEAAGQPVELFALYPPNDTHFQDALSRVRAPVTYISAERLRGDDLWSALEAAREISPDLWPTLEAARGEDARVVFQALRVAREVRLRGIAHLHAHFANAAAGVARLAARFASVPYTLTAHAKDIFHESVQPEDLRRKLSDADGAVTVTDYNLAFLQRQYGPAAARVRRIYNGLDLSRFPHASPEVREPCIVAVGRLIEKKGFGDLIAACALLARAGRGFECHILGTGELDSTLRAHIVRLGLQERVTLLGPRPQGEVIRRVQSAAVFAAPCVVGSDGNRDGLPTTLLEAMALGTPCVSTDVTGIPEVLRDGETGLMVGQHDPAGLAQAIGRLLGDPVLRTRLAAGARRLIESEFNVERNAARLRELWHEARTRGAESCAGL